MDAFFSYGFRPFFLAAAAYAALLMAIWIAFILTAVGASSDAWLPVVGSPFAWHAHEMVFGFAAAAIAGFLLTAVPNWTGALPLSGAPLVFLFLAWLCGRIVMAISGLLPPAIVLTIDVAFLPLLGAFAARQLLVKPAPRNLVFLLLLIAMTFGNVIFHLGTFEFLSVEPLAACRTGMILVALMIAIIGGRIIPAFTNNWMHLNAIGVPMPRRIAWLDAASILSIVGFAILYAASAPSFWQGFAALVACGLNAARLLLWRGWETRSEPIVWILHLGYAWLVVGLALSAVSGFSGALPGSIAIHALGTGAVGTMTLAVMSRASLGHTGRPLVAPRPIVWAYYLVTLAAILRVLGPMLAPSHLAIVLTSAGLAWIGAFTLFVLVYAPILTTPRVHTKTARA